MQGLPDVAAGLFRCLDEEGVEYCVLGDARGFPASIGQSVEIIVGKQARRALPAFLKGFCDRHELQFILRPERARQISSYLLSWSNRERRPEFLNLLVRGDYFRCGRRLWSAAELLKDRARAMNLSDDRCAIYVASAAKEFARSLLQCIDRNELTERDGEYLALQWRLDPEGAALQVARFWDAGREGGVILRAAVANHWEPVRASTGALYSALAFHNVPSPAHLPSDLRRRIRQWRRPQGLLIACLGPDASGMASVIEALTERPLAPFDRGQSMQLRPQVMRPAPAEPKPPRTRKPWGRIGTIAKLMMFAADYWLGYWLRIRPSLVRSTLVVSDRYFDDVLVDPLRYRMDRPRAFARMLSRWIPEPALWLVFDAPAAVLRARQGESRADFERLRSEYRRVLRGRRNVVVLDARQPPEQVVAQAERAIVAETARRTARRLGLPQEAIDNPLSTDILLFFCRRDVPVLSRLVRILFNSDINCRTPRDLHLPHPYGVVIHSQAAIGRRVTVMQQVTIGGKDYSPDVAPIIGDDVYIGAGARVLGDVRVGDRVVIGANAVVTRDIPPGSTVVGANRIIAGRLALATKRSADGSVAHFPVNAQRGANR